MLAIFQLASKANWLKNNNSSSGHLLTAADRSYSMRDKLSMKDALLLRKVQNMSLNDKQRGYV